MWCFSWPKPYSFPCPSTFSLSEHQGGHQRFTTPSGLQPTKPQRKPRFGKTRYKAVSVGNIYWAETLCIPWGMRLLLPRLPRTPGWGEASYSLSTINS